MSFPESVYDAESGLNVKAASCVHLDGSEALQVVRARHLQYDAPGTDTPYASEWPQEALSDLARIDRDHEFLRVLATTISKRGLDNPISDLDLINSVKSDLTFDQSWSVRDMVDLVLDFHGMNANKVPQLTLPVSVVTDPEGEDGGLLYEGYNYGDVEFPAGSEDSAAVDQLLGISASTDSMTGRPLPKASQVTVSVMDGTSTPGQASDTSTALAALGYRTVGTGSTTPTGDVSETVVYYGSRSPTDEAAAESVARSMSGSVIMAYDPSQVKDGAEVTVVTGTEFSVARPAHRSASTTAPTTTSPQSGAIAKASPAKETLAPWDPRACRADARPTAGVRNKINP